MTSLGSSGEADATHGYQITVIHTHIQSRVASVYMYFKVVLKDYLFLFVGVY